MATSSEAGMQLMDNELMKLIKAGVVDPEEAYMRANNKKEFEELVFGEQVDDSTAVPVRPAGPGAGSGAADSAGSRPVAAAKAPGR
jgi:hypothetical protein